MRPRIKRQLARVLYHEKSRLGPVEIQDSHHGLDVIQAWDGTICTDGRPMGEDGTALSGQADGPRTQRQRQPTSHRSDLVDRANGEPLARTAGLFRELEHLLQTISRLGEGGC